MTSYSTRQKYWITTFESVLSYGKVPFLIFVVKNRILGEKQRSLLGLFRKGIEYTLNDICTKKKSGIRGFYAADWITPVGKMVVNGDGRILENSEKILPGNKLDHIFKHVHCLNSTSIIIASYIINNYIYTRNNSSKLVNSLFTLILYIDSI